MPYHVELTDDARRQLRGLAARQRATIADAMSMQLVHQPTVATRNRKPMEPNPWGSWELRVGNLRVYYDVMEGSEPTVTVNAMGVKRRNRVFIDGQEIEIRG